MDNRNSKAAFRTSAVRQLPKLAPALLATQQQQPTPLHRPSLFCCSVICIPLSSATSTFCPSGYQNVLHLVYSCRLLISTVFTMSFTYFIQFRQCLHADLFLCSGTEGDHVTGLLLCKGTGSVCVTGLPLCKGTGSVCVTGLLLCKGTGSVCVTGLLLCKGAEGVCVKYLFCVKELRVAVLQTWTVRKLVQCLT